jgi:hypothetical protein
LGWDSGYKYGIRIVNDEWSIRSVYHFFIVSDDLLFVGKVDFFAFGVIGVLGRIIPSKGRE